ncbi:MAG: endolytic transglycosylase MltG [Mogibacterium sp.]|nr:endolytic transglycosylase MltG [Mogibacterium sp.]MBR4091771.1 endolytic transglycosylase MltG [Mogibacterium sp.]
MSRVERAEAREERAARQAEADIQQAETVKVKKKKKNKGCGCLALLILVLAVLVGAGGYYTLGLMPVDPGSEEKVVVEIPNGSGASAIVEILDDAGLVKNKFCAKVNGRIGGYNSLKANTYIFSPSMSFKEIMTIINEGTFEYISKESVEVKDGARLQQVAEAISEQLPYTADEILEKWSDKEYLNQLIDKYWFLTDEILDNDVMYPLEGYLYADTYFVTSDNSDIEGFTEMCLDRMDEVLTERKDAIQASGFSVHELLTLTSIVTKEATAEDQAGVAGVFMNRLDQGMSLGSDVTVCYIFQEDRVDLKVSQLESTNPYNTRKFAGLPPGPICQVVSDAIDATLNYEKHDYLFFIADEEGIVRYSTDQAGHESNIDEHGLVKDEDSEG